MLDDLAGKRTGERLQILRERRGLSRPVLAGLVGMSASWLKGIERGTRLPPRLPLLVKLAEALAVGDVAVLAGIDMDLGGATSVPVAAFARIPHDAVPAIREAIRDQASRQPDPAATAARRDEDRLGLHGLAAGVGGRDRQRSHLPSPISLRIRAVSALAGSAMAEKLMSGLPASAGPKK